MEEDIEHKIDILNIVQERDFNKETCEDSYIEAVLLGIETVLNELEKLQKENEEYKKFYHRRLKEWTNKFDKQEENFNELLDDYIPKQVIRDKIKEVNNTNWNYEKGGYIPLYTTEILKELLGE